MSDLRSRSGIEGASEAGYGSVDDSAAVGRALPVVRPPPPARTSSVPSTPPTVHAVAPAPSGSSDLESLVEGRSGGSPHRAKIQRTSWWKALVRSAEPVSPEEQRASRRRRVRARTAGLFSILSLASVGGALVIGLRAAPVPGSMVAALAVTMVASRTLIAVALIAYALALLNVAGRFYRGAARPSHDDSPLD
jgi:hypothetical protein